LPTPFAKPPGKGLSSPTVNVLWGLFNAIIGTILFAHSAIKAETTWLESNPMNTFQNQQCLPGRQAGIYKIR
jgi:hypothetical protein